MELPSLMAMSRQMSLQKEMEAIANNVANLNTNGYKADRVTFNAYTQRPAGAAVSASMVFPKLGAPHREMQEGTINATSNPLDVAIRGDAYFVVDTPQGRRFTRNGHFGLDTQNRLVTDTGRPVLDDRNRPLVVPQDAGQVTINSDGSVSAGEQRIGKIQLVAFDDPQQLKRVGDGLFTSDATPKPASDTEVVQGALETANVEPVLEMTRMIETARAYEQAQKILDTENDRMRRGIETLAKVA
ncbi:MAG: flagellar basal-body rod protein FlgF [Gemmatimonas sp.]